ncbi:uncharacterized protein C12orf74 homolog [Leptonychotes weddellii]|uniref:Uncharacterized protein C12orf74 homolog n=1 Tax=Leptonychotes weddellii TaxID=9713 RepID=A0A7F8R0N1_LEPWE|nr:uncharacterized protein C12orf74 homolog [Leptonychotes weddellii]
MGSLSCIGKVEPSCPEVQTQGCGASSQLPLRSLSKKHSENQGKILYFDRQAPGRISTSPTLRRLRGNGRGTSHSLSQQETLEMPTGKEPAGSPCYLSKSLPGSPKNSSHSQLPLRLQARLPPDPKRALNTTDSFEPHPALQPISEGSLLQASLPEKGGHSPPNPATWPPGPHITQL